MKTVRIPTRNPRRGAIPVRIVIGMLALAASVPAHAYIDPGTGSVLLQSLLAGVAVAIGVLRNYWHRVRAWLSPNRSGTAAPDTAPSAAGEDTEATSER